MRANIQQAGNTKQNAPNQRMQPDLRKRYALAEAADAGRYELLQFC